MKSENVVLVFDCGSTNVRVIAINSVGKIIAGESLPNNTTADPFLDGGVIWDIDEIWSKLCEASQKVTTAINKTNIVGVTVTTFGVDGAPFDQNGKMIYPVISWQCSRTIPIMNQIDKYLSLKELYALSGVVPYNFNTINKLIWFRENRPELLTSDGQFLFIPSILINRLSGERVNDITMAGTSMMTELRQREFSPQILKQIGVERALFGTMGEPGTVVGQINRGASEVTGIPVGVPVCLAGHDTQFAIYGSGAALNEPVLSSGTWEILMSRSLEAKISQEQFDLGITTELDAVPGIFDIGMNWMGSGLLEWGSKNLFADLTGNSKYDTMIDGASKVIAGSGGISVLPNFFNESSVGKAGAIDGLSLTSSRFEIYRAMLEALSYQLKDGIVALQKAGNFKAESVRVVGGGSKNQLWNQIRADVCGIPVQLISQKETTVLGAALFAFAGIGYFGSAEEARAQIDYQPVTVEPSAESGRYSELYEAYKLKWK